MGPAPPFFELSLRRFPFKNVFQGPQNDESKNGGCWEKQPLTALLPLVLLPNLFHVLGKEPHQLALPVAELERSPQRAPLHPFSVTPGHKQGKQHRSLVRDQADENNGKSCCSQKGGNDEGSSEWNVAEKGQQRRKGHLPTPA